MDEREYSEICEFELSSEKIKWWVNLQNRCRETRLGKANVTTKSELIFYLELLASYGIVLRIL